MALQRNIGLLGGVAIVVGSVIGMGAFVLLPIVCSLAGTAAWLAIVLAVSVSVVSMIPLIQLGMALPVAGGGYEYGRRLLSQGWGVMLSWWGILGGTGALALVSYGLVESFSAFIPDGVSLHLAALLVVLGFFLLQRIGLRMLAAVQVALVLQMFAALLIYALGGLTAAGHGFEPSLPIDASFGLALAVAFNVCLGFQVVVELGEEMRSPERNMLRTLLISALAVVLMYLLLVAAYTHLVGADRLSVRPDIAVTAASFLPPSLVAFMRFGIIGAALTSFNGTAIAIPREIFAQGRGGALPSFLAKVDVSGNPRNAVSLYFALVIALLALGAALDAVGVLTAVFGSDVIEFYGFITVSGILMLTIGLSIAAWRLPKRMTELYRNASIRFNPGLLRSAIVFSSVFNVGLVLVMFSKWPVPLFMLLASAVVYLRVIRVAGK